MGISTIEPKQLEYISQEDNEIRQDPANILPRDIMLHILSNLQGNLIDTSCVSKKWKELANNEHLWEKLAKQYEILIPKGENAKAVVFDRLMIVSKEKFVKRIEEFLETKGIRQFICHFRSNPQALLVIRKNILNDSLFLRGTENKYTYLPNLMVSENASNQIEECKFGAIMSQEYVSFEAKNLPLAFSNLVKALIRTRIVPEDEQYNQLYNYHVTTLTTTECATIKKYFIE